MNLSRLLKLIIPVLILMLLFTFNSYASTVSTPNSPSISSKQHLILGSYAYITKIEMVIHQTGYKSALTQIKKDVDIYGSDLDYNYPGNNQRLYKLTSLIIGHLGYVDMETHYFRNKLNRAPQTLNEMIAVNKSLPISKRWILLAVINSAYHVQGLNGQFNLKFISYDGFCEAVYNRNGVLLNEKNDPVNMGTFNYAAGIPGVGSHSKYDVAPFLVWGNTIDSPEKGSAIITRNANIALLNCKTHAAEVFMYRKVLFGMQDGRVL